MATNHARTDITTLEPAAEIPYTKRLFLCAEIVMPASVSAQPPVFVINLDSSPERYQHAEQQLLALGITPQRYAAVYGKDLTPEQVAACYDQAANLQYFRRSLSPGELGCYFSLLHGHKHRIYLGVRREGTWRVDE